MSTLRIAYIGAGNFSNSSMFPQLARHDMELTGICDLDEARVTRAQQRYGFAKAYTDFRLMLDAEKPDAVFCVGGPRVHHPVGLEVLDRGIPLYVQKPAAPTVESIRELDAMAKKKNVVCHVGYNLRHSTAISQARRIMTEEDFGPVQSGMFRYGIAYGRTLRDAIMEQHCHIIDTVLYLFGEPDLVTVTTSKEADQRHYTVTLRFPGGAVVTINAASGQILFKGFISFEVTGKDSFIRSDDCGALTWVRPQPEPWWKNPVPDLTYRRGSFGDDHMLETWGYIADVDNFLAAVRGEAPDHCPVGDTIATTALCEEIVRQVELCKA